MQSISKRWANHPPPSVSRISTNAFQKKYAVRIYYIPQKNTSFPSKENTMYNFIENVLTTVLSPLKVFSPSDKGAPYSREFAELNGHLKEEGCGVPLLVVDLDKVDANLDKIRSFCRPERQPRLVVKSLPCVELLRHCMQSLNTTRLMVFHLPFLLHIAETFPKVDILLGKPLPRSALKTFLHRSKRNEGVRVRWLIDSPQRLQQYIDLCTEENVVIEVCIEIDVGLHRGGVGSLGVLREMCELLESVKCITLCGFMGYDPHVPKSPVISMPAALEVAMTVYKDYVKFCSEEYPGLVPKGGFLLNGAGSPTYQLHENSLINDFSIGSCVVQPGSFDGVAGHIPAFFIAAPILKKLDNVTIPFLEAAARVVSWWDVNARQSFFLYGGEWDAALYEPKGLSLSALYGRSANQELVVGSPTTNVSVDDHVFLRPRVSEALMLHFGDLYIVRSAKCVARWPVLSNGGV